MKDQDGLNSHKTFIWQDIRVHNINLMDFIIIILG